MPPEYVCDVCHTPLGSRVSVYPRTDGKGEVRVVICPFCDTGVLVEADRGPEVTVYDPDNDEWLNELS